MPNAPVTEAVYDAASLEQLAGVGVPLAVLGHPVGHSLSPCMHNAALQWLAEHEDPRYADWHYYKIDVPPRDLPEQLPRMRALGFHGVNLTVPHKVELLRYGLAETVQTQARKIGAANTLKRESEGYHAFNTDGFGLSRAVAEAFYGGQSQPFSGRTVVLLGAGGAARAAAHQCLDEGCKQLWIGNRDVQRLQQLVDQLGDDRVQPFSLAQAPESFDSDGVLINATSVGLKPDDPVPFSLSRLHGEWVVYDMIYNPPKTAMLREAEQMPFACDNGLGMLVWQGAWSLGIWATSLPESAVDLAARVAPIMRGAAENALASSSASTTPSA